MRRSPLKANRRSTRHSVGLVCQVVRERDFQLIADRIVNLSATGLMVSPADPALTGERLIVSFQIPVCTTCVPTSPTEKPLKNTCTWILHATGLPFAVTTTLYHHVCRSTGW